MDVLAYSVILLRVKDLEAETRFYADALGLELKRVIPDELATFLVPGGPELELVLGGEIVPPVTDRKETPAIPIFHTPDVEKVMNRAVEHGGRIVNPPFTIGRSFLAYVADPEGHVIGLSSRNQSAE